MTATAAPTNFVHELVLDALSAATPLRISGRSHWMDAGRPVNATRIASLAAHSGIVDYVPGDLTITVRAGTPLREIEDATRANGQWLPLDPFGTKDGTIGATIATGSFGPLAHAFGRARDLVLGIEFVTGDGRLARGGGRVVKNVAGFDLVRLLTGSWGTLGIITEATLRLYSLPSPPITISLGAPDSATALDQRIASILSSPGIPFAVELVSADTAAAIGLSRKQQILIKLGGNSAAIAAQRAALTALGGATEVDPQAWDRLRVLEDEMKAATVVRISTLPTRLSQVWSTVAANLSGSGAAMSCTPSLGIMRCALPASMQRDQIEQLMASVSGTSMIFERLPADLWQPLSPTVIGDTLAQRVKQAFDPAGILNPGILGATS